MIVTLTCVRSHYDCDSGNGMTAASSPERNQERLDSDNRQLNQQLTQIERL